MPGMDGWQPHLYHVAITTGENAEEIGMEVNPTQRTMNVIGFCHL